MARSFKPYAHDIKSWLDDILSFLRNLHSQRIHLFSFMNIAAGLFASSIGFGAYFFLVLELTMPADMSGSVK